MAANLNGFLLDIKFYFPLALVVHFCALRRGYFIKKSSTTFVAGNPGTEAETPQGEDTWSVPQTCQQP